MNPNWTLILFTAIAAVGIALALAFVLPPLLRQRKSDDSESRRELNIAIYREQLREIEADRAAGLLSLAQFEAARLEIETRLAEDALLSPDTPQTPVTSRRLGYTLAGLLPAAAIGIYLWLGNPQILITEAQAHSADAGINAAEVSQSMREVLQRTRSHPEDGDAWSVLARAYAAGNDWPLALRAYEKANQLKPEVPVIMTGYAEALAISRGRVLQGEPIKLVLNALEKDPNDFKGLELAGLNAFQEKNYAQAAYYFKHLLKLVPAEAPYAADIRAAQQEANRLARAASTGLDDLSAPKAMP